MMTIRLLTGLLAVAGMTVFGDVANAASLASGKKLAVKVDPKKIEAEKTALWAKFGGWCAIAEWHPAIKKCEESKEGDDTFRTLTLADAGTIKEKLLAQRPISYRYAIIERPLPVKNYEAQFSIVPDDDDEDEINIAWAATYGAEGKPDKEARGIIDGIFKDGLASIKEKLGEVGDDDDDKDEKK